MKKKVAIQLEEEWEAVVNNYAGLVTGTWISISVLRPFLFFITCLSTQHRNIRVRDIDCIQKCLKLILESMNSSGMPAFFQLLIGFIKIFWLVLFQFQFSVTYLVVYSLRPASYLVVVLYD